MSMARDREGLRVPHEMRYVECCILLTSMSIMVNLCESVAVDEDIRTVGYETRSRERRRGGESWHIFRGLRSPLGVMVHHYRSFIAYYAIAHSEIDNVHTYYQYVASLLLGPLSLPILRCFSNSPFGTLCISSEEFIAPSVCGMSFAPNSCND